MTALVWTPLMLWLGGSLLFTTGLLLGAFLFAACHRCEPVPFDEDGEYGGRW